MIKKIVMYLPGIVFPMAINFILTLLYAAYLSPGEYGTLNLYLNSIQLVYSLSLSVFQTSSLRFYSLNEVESDKEFVSTYFFANIACGCFLIIPMVLLNLFFQFDWWIVVLSIGINGLFGFWGNWYRLIDKANGFNLMKLVSSIITLGSLLVFSKLISPLSYIFPLLAIYGSYGVICLFVVFQYSSKLSVTSVSVPLIKKSISFGFPLIGVSVLNLLVANSDQYLLAYYLGNEAVGNYALGYRLVDAIVANLLMIITFVMTPELNRIHDTEGQENSAQVLKKMINAAIWMILPISVVIIILAPFIITFLYPEYKSATVIMQLVVFASIFHGISMFTCKGLELVKRPKYVFYSLLIAGIVNAVYNIIFIRIYGINASAHSSIIAYVIYNLLLLVFTKRYYLIEWDYAYILKTIIVTAVTAGIACILIRIIEINSLIELLIVVSICGVCYLSFSFFFKLYSVFK